MEHSKRGNLEIVLIFCTPPNWRREFAILELQFKKYELAAVCREHRVVVGAAGRRSSAGGAASCQFMSPGLPSVVSSTPVEGAPVAPNLTRPTLVPSPLHFHTPAHYASGELDSCEVGVFRSHCFLLLFLRLIFNKHRHIKKFKKIKLFLRRP